MQATPDIFLGWTRSRAGRDFYLRQLWDMKGSVDTNVLEPVGLSFYAGICAWALARAHARSGDSVAISAYLGTSDTFDGAVADFSETYADQNERDHRGYRAAITAGQISTVAGFPAET
jgi:NAD(P)H-dependent flavin oxidoreductase YrpB (nitropropane dioxygenase family)